MKHTTVDPENALNVADRPVPARTGRTKVTPLIEASESFPALENAIFDAEHEIMMAYWTFDPRVRLHGSHDLDSGSTWQDLILHKAAEGVVVRIIIGDFDPVFGHDFHATNGQSYLDLMELRERLPEDKRHCLQIITSLNDARGGRLPELLMQPVRWAVLRELCKSMRERMAEEGREAVLDRLRTAPGIWPYIEMKEDGPHARRVELASPIYPAAHHEKTCMIDRFVAFVGGLDIDAKRYDTPKHEAADAWHDLVVRIEGAPVGRLGNRLARRWNEEREKFAAFLARQHTELGGPPEAVPLWPECPTERLDLVRLDDDTPTPGDPDAELVSTASRSARSPWRRTPRAVDTGIREALFDLIGSAERLLYIETQFLRDQDVAWRIAEQAEAHPDLHVIVVLPLLPEMMSNQPSPNSATRHGHWLQWRCATILRTRLAERCGIYTLIRNAPSAPDAQIQATAFGSDLIYCHAKLAIADDERALVGSANLNGRSLAMDTEACLYWRDPEGVAPFRRRLWRQHFGGGLAGGSETLPDLEDADLHAAAEAWRRRALENERLYPGDRHGYVVPYPEDHMSFQAGLSWMVPDNGV